MARADDIKTGLVRIAFAQHLHEPQDRKNDSGQVTGQNYGCTLLIPKTDTATLSMMEQNIIDACVAENWGDEAKVKKMIADGLIKLPVLDGDGRQGLNKNTGERHPGFAGHFFLRVTSGVQFPPVVLDVHAQPIASKDPKRLKSGDYGYAGIAAYTWNNDKQGKGVTFGIGVFQKIKDGESLGGSGGPDLSKFKAEAVDTSGAPEDKSAGASSMFG